MSEEFDPYHKWLGIPAKDQPPNHYRLLGLDLFESDPDVIEAAAFRQTAHVRTYQLGPHSDFSQKLLNEIAAAKVCLLDPQKRAAYDEELRGRLRAVDGRRSVPPAVAPSQTTEPPVVPVRPVVLAVGQKPAKPVRRTKSTWPVYAGLGAVALLLVVLLAIVTSGPEPDEVVDIEQQRTNANHAVEITDAHAPAESIPGVADAPPSETPRPAQQQSQQKVTSPGQNQPSPPEAVPATASPAAAAIVETHSGDLKPDDAPNTQIRTIPPLPPDAEEQLKSSLGEARSPQDFQAVTEKALRYVDQALAVNDAEAAKKLVTWAVAAARDGKDDELSKSATVRYLELQGPLTEGVFDGARRRLGTWKPMPVLEADDVPMVSAASQAPAPAIAPFDEKTAKHHQAVWAKHLGLPVELENSIGMRFVLIPPGEFEMGSTTEDVSGLVEEAKSRKLPDWYIGPLPSEAPRHRVRITKPFYVGQGEVTQAEYERVMGDNPSKFKNDPSRPAEMVNWDEAVKFCRKLNELPQERAIRAAYRLPTEAEWEYACRAGTTTNWYGGEDEATLTAQAWFGLNAGGTTHPTRRKTANAWGLYDMHGNVWEWCQDWRDTEYYAKSPFDDPTGAATGSMRVIRGGGWPDYAGLCRSAYRRGGSPGHRSGILGFRLARGASDRAQKTMENGKPTDGSNEGKDAASVPASDAPRRSLADLLKEDAVEKETTQVPVSTDSVSRVSAAAGLSEGGLKPPSGAILLMTFESDTLVPKSGRVHVKDLSGAGHTGELHGAKVVPGMVGKGLEFDGKSSVMVSGRFPSGGSPRTISAWILCNSQQGCTVLFYGVPTIGRAFGFIAWGGLDDGEWAFLGYGCGLPTGMRVDANWHHHVVSYDGTDVEYYFDAERKLRSPARNVGGKKEIIRLDTAPEPMRLGVPLNETSRAFIGKLDELAVFDRVLSAEEVQTLYRMGVQGTALAK